MARQDPPKYRADDPEWQGVMSRSGVERLQAYVKNLNNLRSVADSGQPYFVARRTKPDGTTEHFVDRAV